MERMRLMTQSPIRVGTLLTMSRLSERNEHFEPNILFFVSPNHETVKNNVEENSIFDEIKLMSIFMIIKIDPCHGALRLIFDRFLHQSGLYR